MALKTLLLDVPWGTCSSIIMNKHDSCVMALCLYALPIADQTTAQALPLVTYNAEPP